MAHWCESCGQELPTGEMASEATWLVEPGTDQQSFAKPAGAKQSGQDKKLLMAVVSALIIWGLFVGLGRIVTPDDSIDEQAAAKMEQARLDQEAEVAAEAEAAATERRQKRPKQRRSRLRRSPAIMAQQTQRQVSRLRPMMAKPEQSCRSKSNGCNVSSTAETVPRSSRIAQPKVWWSSTSAQGCRSSPSLSLE